MQEIWMFLLCCRLNANYTMDEMGDLQGGWLVWSEWSPFKSTIQPWWRAYWGRWCSYLSISVIDVACTTCSEYCGEHNFGDKNLIDLDKWITITGGEHSCSRILKYSSAVLQSVNSWHACEPSAKYGSLWSHLSAYEAHLEEQGYWHSSAQRQKSRKFHRSWQYFQE